MHNRAVPAEATAATIEDAAGGRSSRTRAPHAALEMLPGLPAAAGHQLTCRGKTDYELNRRVSMKQS